MEQSQPQSCIGVPSFEVGLLSASMNAAASTSSGIYPLIQGSSYQMCH